jgi:3-deoxy-7-phosphoheptulonate synthase
MIFAPLLMIVILKPKTSKEQVEEVAQEVQKLGYSPHVIYGELQTVIAAIGDERTHHTLESLAVFPQVERVLPVQKRYKLVSRESKSEETVVNVDGVLIGGGHFVVMAGPCSVESEEQLISTARAVKALGAKILRGGAYKPRTSPYEFQGLGREGLRIMAAAKQETGLKIITEVLSGRDVEHVCESADILQVGARNAQNFQLLIECAKSRKTVLLKRGMSERIEEWLLAAEYILSNGNPNVLLCERGIRTFETYTRNTMDISAIPIIHKLSHLPMTADPSHGTGRRDKVAPMARASVAAGADALLIEVHCSPDTAWSDGAQSLFPEQFAKLMDELRMIAPAVGRKIA